MSELSLRKELVQYSKRLYARGLVGAAEGNLSVRVDAETILCTPSGMSKGYVRPADLVLMDLAGRLADPRQKPSSEIGMHLTMYQARPDCLAVVHAHPITATGFSVAGVTLPDNVLPEAAAVLGPVALVPFAFPGTRAVGDGLKPFLENHKSFLLSNHGAVTMGRNLRDAFERMETLERCFQIYSVAMNLGTPRLLPTEAFDRLLATSLDGRLR